MWKKSDSYANRLERYHQFSQSAAQVDLDLQMIAPVPTYPSGNCKPRQPTPLKSLYSASRTTAVTAMTIDRPIPTLTKSLVW